MPPMPRRCQPGSTYLRTDRGSALRTRRLTGAGTIGSIEPNAFWSAFWVARRASPARPSGVWVAGIGAE